MDTSALLAILDADDQFHTAAVETYDALLESGADMWLTSYLRGETAALVHRRLGFEPLRALMEGLDGVVSTVWIEQALHQAIWEDFVSRGGRRFGFVDCSTALIAKALDATIFAVDSDFSLEGLQVVP